MILTLIAFGVAMDCTAVSAAYALRKLAPRDLAKLAVTFGSFQAGTAIIGALGGREITLYLAGWDAWIAFFLLFGVGSHMIYEAFFDHDDEVAVASQLSIASVLALGVATSIDSLAVGASLPTLGLPIFMSGVTIGIVSFLMSFVGAWAGVRAGERFGPSVEVLGGIVLIIIGVRAIWTPFMT